MENYEDNTTDNLQVNPQLATPLLGKNYWWTHYKSDNEDYKEGFREAFISLFGHSPEILDRNASTAAAINTRTHNKNNPSYWLKFWLESSINCYNYRQANIYYIPITEFGGTGHGRYGRATHAETRMAFDLFHSGRTSYFPTDIFMEIGDEVDIKVSNLDDPQTICFAATSNLYPYRIMGKVELAENQNITYKAIEPGTLMLACVNNKKEMQSWGKKIKMTAIPKNTNKGKKVPLFIFGINTQKEWVQDISQNPNPFNHVQLFNGLHRIYIPGDKVSTIPHQIFINQLLAEYLLIGTAYDRFNGFDGSSALHLPTQNLQIITYERCGYSSYDLIAVCNDIDKRKSKTLFVDWHEMGHQNTMGWSWGTEIEVIANLYELIAERLFKGKTAWNNYDIYYYAPEYFDSDKYGTSRAWDSRSVINFIQAKVNLYDLEAGYDVMSSITYDERNPQYQLNEKDETWTLKYPQHINNEFLRLQLFYQLLFTYSDDFYSKLGKAYREQWNYSEGWDTFNTNQKDKNWFVQAACDITKTNLLPFFDAWGLGISPNVRKKIELQGYPFPK